MADCIEFNKLEKSIAQLKSKVSSEVSAPKLVAMYMKVIEGFIPFCRRNAGGSLALIEIVGLYYEHVTKSKPFSRPDTVFLRRLARPVFMILDILEGRSISKKYCYNTCETPQEFTKDIRQYRKWLTESNNAQDKIQTRVGRIKQFLIHIHSIGCVGINELTADILICFIGNLSDRYSSTGKTNILYTLRNYFSCPYVKNQLEFDPLSFLTNLHTNKHERLELYYAPEEIQRVLSAVDRTTANGKMHYLMMLFAGLYGLRSCDIRMLEFTNIDWKRQLIMLNQHKTGGYLELPLIQEVLLAILDYVRNARPDTTDSHIFIRQRSPHLPYSDNNHFANKIAAYFKEAGVSTKNKHAGLHSMRHSLATALLKDNVPIHDIADILGHSSLQSTTKYIWSDMEQLRSAALEVIPYVK